MAANFFKYYKLPHHIQIVYLIKEHCYQIMTFTEKNICLISNPKEVCLWENDKKQFCEINDWMTWYYDDYDGFLK